MLDIETLHQLPDLSASALYHAETARLPRLTREQSRTLAQQARQGDEEARHALIVACMDYILLQAHNISSTRHPNQIDLAAVGNLKMVECLDKALLADAPVAYLLTVALREMQWYCLYHAPLIQRPAFSLKELAQADPSPAQIESLDAPVSRGGGRQREMIAAPTPALETDEQPPRFAPLYDAVQRLSPTHRSRIIRHYGLFGQPAESLTEIAQESGILYESVIETTYLARKRLRVILANHLARMLTRKPQHKEEA